MPAQATFEFCKSCNTEEEDYKSKMDFDDLFQISIYLKRGNFGDLYRCFEKETGKEYAVKVLSHIHDGCVKEESENKNDLKFTREGAIWRRLQHRNIVELVRVFKTPTEQYLVIESIRDGNLFDQIVNFTTYTERDTYHFMKQLFEALAYLRGKRIVHRDIKTDNLLVKQSHYGEILKLTDFGLSVRLEKGKKFVREKANGAPIHLAPEIIMEKPFNYAVDMWSVGIIFYTLLGGYPPFYNDLPDKLYADVLTKEVRMPSPFWDNVSENAKELVIKLLDKNPITRFTAEEALNHSWIDEKTVIPKMHRKRTIVELKKFNARRKLKGAIFSVQTLCRLRKPNKQRGSHDGTKNHTLDLETRLFKIDEQDRRASTTVVSKTSHKNLPNERKLSEVNVLFSPKNIFIDLRSIAES